MAASHNIHLLEFTTEEGPVTRGSLSAMSNVLDSTDHFKLATGLDTEYYLKIVSSEYVYPIWGSENFYEFST